MNELSDELEKQKEWNRAFVFNSSGKTIGQKAGRLSESEAKAMITVFSNRDLAISKGVTIEEQPFEVHRYHPPLIYGRKADGDKLEGFCLAKGTNKYNESVFMLITYLLPIVSARAIPRQIEFFNVHVGCLDKS